MLDSDRGAWTRCGGSTAASAILGVILVTNSREDYRGETSLQRRKRTFVLAGAIRKKESILIKSIFGFAEWRWRRTVNLYKIGSQNQRVKGLNKWLWVRIAKNQDQGGGLKGGTGGSAGGAARTNLKKMIAPSFNEWRFPRRQTGLDFTLGQRKKTWTLIEIAKQDTYQTKPWPHSYRNNQNPNSNNSTQKEPRPCPCPELSMNLCPRQHFLVIQAFAFRPMCLPTDLINFTPFEFRKSLCRYSDVAGNFSRKSGSGTGRRGVRAGQMAKSSAGWAPAWEVFA